MTVTLGLALLILGFVLVMIAVPRKGQEARPVFRRSAFALAVYPALCLALVTFGAAILLSSYLSAA